VRRRSRRSERGPAAAGTEHRLDIAATLGYVPVGPGRVDVTGDAAYDLELRDVARTFDGGAVAVDGVSLQVAAGELVSLLGPSGCGKTTTLRIVAGFVDPDAGQVLIKAVDVTDLPPERRDIGMVFQSYALFPHMTVEANVAYGLRMRRVPPGERRRRVAEALDLVRLGELAGRYPRQLSGGQQQRVALARAVVIRPSVLLLDEPLSNLDARLRHEMRSEIRQLQQHLRITTVFVTHDQDEALTMSDRVVVMNRGRVEQVGSPRAIYTEPQTRFVAGFIGEATFFEGRIGPTTGAGTAFVTRQGLALTVAPVVGGHEGEPAIASLRAEAVSLLTAGEAATARFANRATGILEEIAYLGADITYRVRLDDQTLVRISRRDDAGDARTGELRRGARVEIGWEPGACRIIERG
jgi:putative spermidine/putrescine transport system ATP-binding protein